MRFASVIFSLLVSAIIFCQDIDEIEELVSKDSFDLALEKTNHFLAKNSSNTKALALRINIYFLKKEYKEAAKYVDEALRRHSREGEFHYLSGIINVARGRNERALKDLNRAIDLENVENPYKIYLYRGAAYRNLQEYELAFNDINKAISLNEESAMAYHSRGMLNYDLKDYHEAVKDFKKALSLLDSNPETLFNLGMSYFRLGDEDEACPYLRQACSLGNINACRMSILECLESSQ